MLKLLRNGASLLANAFGVGCSDWLDNMSPESSINIALQEPDSASDDRVCGYVTTVLCGTSDLDKRTSLVCHVQVFRRIHLSQAATPF
jgi:hypothetical protein